MNVRYIDLFCGIGGFRIGAEQAFKSRGISGTCIFSSDIDPEVRRVYKENFGELPDGDIQQINAGDIPEHDLLLAGFPCQPFSIMGSSKGFEDTRGTLFFDVARILQEKKPKAFVLENVKQLAGHDGGRTLSRILETFDQLGYKHSHRILNALDFGLPQKRERIIIVGFLDNVSFAWPLSSAYMAPLSSILENDIPSKYYVSEQIRQQRLNKCKPTNEITIWHENKGGHVSALPYSCALRASASYNYLLVNGERRLTPREMLRLQGFPDTFIINSSYMQVRKQTGNAVPVPMVQTVIERVIDALGWSKSVNDASLCDQYSMVMEDEAKYAKSAIKNG